MRDSTSRGVQGGSVASLCGYDTKVCGFDFQPAPLAYLFMKKSAATEAIQSVC